MAPLGRKYNYILLSILLVTINAAPLTTPPSNDADENVSKTEIPGETPPIPVDPPTEFETASTLPDTDTTEQAGRSEGTIELSEVETTSIQPQEDIDTSNNPSTECVTEEQEDNLMQTQNSTDATTEIPPNNQTENLTVDILSIAHDDADNEIMNYVELNEKHLLINKTSGQLQVAAPYQVEVFDASIGKVQNAEGKTDTDDLREEIASGNDLEDSVYNIETNDMSNHSVEIKQLKSGEALNSAEGNRISDEVFETRLDVNASGEAVTTRYFSSEELNITGRGSSEEKVGFNLTTLEPTFSEEKLDLQELRAENQNATASNESLSSEAIATKFHDEPSEEAVTTRFISGESVLLESFEVDRNETLESTEASANLTTTNPFSSSSESVEHVIIIKKMGGPLSRRITMVENADLNEAEEATSHQDETETHHDDRLHILQAKPEEMIPIHGITSQEAFEMIGKSSANDTNTDTGLEETSTDDDNATTTTDYEELDGDAETIAPFSGEHELGQINEYDDQEGVKVREETSLDGQFLGIMRGLMFNHMR